MASLRTSIIQANIIWEEKERNLQHYGALLSSLAGKTDLAVLPEMFSTGFSINNSRHLAETTEGLTMQTVREWAKTWGFAICGSFLAKDGNQLYNRGFFATPENEIFYYDKRHLFRMGEENGQFSAGNQRLIIPYKGWNIMLIICYDLRFPVWIRNQNNQYDLLVCAANWPEARSKVWQILLQARALENLSYVCGVNRIGLDGHQVAHQGDSALINFKGEYLAQGAKNTEEILTVPLDKEKLEEFRKKFPAWKDADDFSIKL